MGRAMPLSIVVDTREQTPYRFTGAPCYEGVTVTVGKLETGDYSVAGLESHLSVERKSLPDLVRCLGGERERFVRELERGRGLECFAVVVEGSFEALAHHSYQGQLNAHSAVQSVCAFMARMSIPFVFAGSRPAAEYATWSLLHQWVQGRRNELRALERALTSSLPKRVAVPMGRASALSVVGAKYSTASSMGAGGLDYAEGKGEDAGRREAQARNEAAAGRR